MLLRLLCLLTRARAIVVQCLQMSVRLSQPGPNRIELLIVQRIQQTRRMCSARHLVTISALRLLPLVLWDGLAVAVGGGAWDGLLGVVRGGAWDGLLGVVHGGAWDVLLGGVHGGAWGGSLVVHVGA